MKKAFVWYFIFTKRHLKRISTIFILLAMLLLTVAMKMISTTMTISVDVGFFMEDLHSDNTDTVSYEVIHNISNALENHDGLIHFIAYSSDETLRHDVETGNIQCGYVLGSSLYNSVTTGNTKNLVELIETPENSISLLADIVILATIMEHSACDILIEDILAQDFFTNISSDDLETVRTAYNTFASNGSTFSFDYSTLYDEYKGSSNTLDISSYLITPVRGVIAIFIFISALTGGVSWFNDSDSTLYANIPPRKHHRLRLMTIAIPTFLSFAMGYISTIAIGLSTDYGYELLALAAYALMCILFTYALSYLTPKNIFCALIPVFILGSVVCSPIFFNIGNLIPTMRFLQNLFLPTHYFIFF